MIGGLTAEEAVSLGVVASDGRSLSSILQSLADTAAARNPIDLPVMPSPPTIVTTGGTDPSPSKDVGYWVGTNRANFEWNGVPSNEASVWLAVLSTNYVRPRLPRTTLSGSQGPSVGGWSWSFWTDAPLFHVAVVGFTFHVAVDDQLTSAAGYDYAGASGSLWIDFSATRILRKITIFGQDDGAVYRLRLGASDSLFAGRAQRPNIVFASDSYFTGTTSPQVKYLYSLPGMLRAISGWNVICQAIGGSGYVTEGTATQNLQNSWRWDDVAAALPDAIVIPAGTNDVGLAGIQAGAEASLQLARAANPGVPIVVLGPWPKNLNLSANLLACEAAISAAVTAVADPLCTFRPISTASATVSPWVTGSGDTNTAGTAGNSTLITGDDGTHLSSPLGARNFAQRIRDEVLAGLRSIGR